jgi:diaminopimelate decarboxylase
VRKSSEDEAALARLRRDPDQERDTRWWEHESLGIQQGRVCLDGSALDELARQHGTPLYAYSRATLQRQLSRLQAALAAITQRYRIYYAVKANRCSGVLRAVHDFLGVGVDTCSPRELELALESDFPPELISFNAGMLSDGDLARVASRGVHCTLDTFSALRRYGALVPRGTPVGLRFDPGISAGYGGKQKTAYGGGKFGFELSDCQRALQAAGEAGLRVDSVHMHIGWGLPEESAEEIEGAFMRLAAVARQVPELQTVNVGGGLGGRYRAEDRPLTLSTWSGLLERHLVPLGVTIACEPGTFIAAPAGVLLVQVNTVEERRGTHWVGVDAGHAINPCPALYGIPLEIVHLRTPLAPPVHEYTVAGHINEAVDIWARGCRLPEVREGDFLALLPAGAYGASMASDHCLRGQVKELVL